MRLTARTITAAQITKLMDEAAQAGDLDMVKTCRKALAGRGGKGECVKAIKAARAQVAAAKASESKSDRLARIRATVAANKSAGRDTFAGLTSSEIADRNGAEMFGDNDEAFPDQAEWSAWVD